MDELERLKKEKLRLLGIKQGREQAHKKKRKIRVLKREIRQMKSPKVIRVIRGVAVDSTKGVGIIISAEARKASPVVKKGLQNLAENARRQAQAERRPVKKE